MSELIEDVIYRCRCGAEMEWRITPETENGIHLQGKVFYPRLATRLLQLIDEDKAGRLRIRLATVKKAEVVLSRKGRSRAVTVGNSKATTYGRLNLDTGEYIVVKDLEGLSALLEEANVSLHNAAIRYGLMTEKCSYCGRHLSDPRSMTAGYGRVCGEHHKLPWGRGLMALNEEKTIDSPVDRRADANHSNERITYKCGCGAEIAWQVVFGVTAQVTAVPHNRLYPGLTASLSRLIENSKLDHFRFRFATAMKAKVVLVRNTRFRVVSVTDGGSKSYGRLTLETGEYISENELEGLSDLLREINDDFLGAVKKHGERTGICTFCGRKLTDPRSVLAGYGPICAEKFGLPWGGAVKKGAAPRLANAPKRAPAAARLRL
jgi:Family of unknown function (DUF6011)